MMAHQAMKGGRRDRYLGALFGLAVGDALGFPVQFKRPGEFEPVRGMRFWPGGADEATWSDDTSMALCLAESLLATGGFDPADQMARYVRWLDHGHLSSRDRAFDVGDTVYRALLGYKRTREPFSGPDDAFSAGNGSLMRLAPVPMFFAADPALAVEMSGLSSRTTHQARSCIDACRYFGGLLAGALRGASREELLAGVYEPYPGAWEVEPLCDEILEMAEGSFKLREPPLIRGTGHVTRSLEAALWAFYRAETFREAVLMAVNLGDDADTTGAICGQLAGACWGFSTIPEEWSGCVARWQLIADMANALCDMDGKDAGDDDAHTV